MSVRVLTSELPRSSRALPVHRFISFLAGEDDNYLCTSNGTAEVASMLTTDCQAACRQNSDCKYFSSHINGQCRLFSACARHKSPGEDWTTFKKTFAASCPASDYVNCPHPPCTATSQEVALKLSLSVLLQEELPGQRMMIAHQLAKVPQTACCIGVFDPHRLTPPLCLSLRILSVLGVEARSSREGNYPCSRESVGVCYREDSAFAAPASHWAGALRRLQVCSYKEWWQYVLPNEPNRVRRHRWCCDRLVRLHSQWSRKYWGRTEHSKSD